MSPPNSFKTVSSIESAFSQISIDELVKRENRALRKERKVAINKGFNYMAGLINRSRMQREMEMDYDFQEYYNTWEHISRAIEEYTGEVYSETMCYVHRLVLVDADLEVPEFEMATSETGKLCLYSGEMTTEKHMALRQHGFINDQEIAYLAARALRKGIGMLIEISF